MVDVAIGGAPPASARHLDVASDGARRPSDTEIRWEASPERARERANTERRPLLLFFRADWSAASVQMERGVLADDVVARAARVFVAARVDATDEKATSAEYWLQATGVIGVPAIVLIEPGTGRKDILEGQVEAEELTERLNAFVE